MVVVGASLSSSEPAPDVNVSRVCLCGTVAALRFPGRLPLRIRDLRTARLQRAGSGTEFEQSFGGKQSIVEFHMGIRFGSGMFCQHGFAGSFISQLKNSSIQYILVPRLLPSFLSLVCWGGAWERGYIGPRSTSSEANSWVFRSQCWL